MRRRRALAHSAKARPDVFLLDIGLPEMDGNTLVGRLREQPETADEVTALILSFMPTLDDRKPPVA